MPAEIESMFSHREVPWHRQGEVVQEAPTWRDAVRLAGLDWEVEKRPLLFRRGNGNTAKVEGHYALVRKTDEKVLGPAVTDRYKEFQNHEAFQLLDTLVDEGLQYETAGSLYGGKKIWCMAYVPRDIKVAGEDVHKLFLYCSTEHTGTGGIRVGITPVRIVCANTMNLALRNTKRSFLTGHVGDLQGKIQQAREALSLTWSYAEEFEQFGTMLAEQSVTDAQFEAIVKDALPENGKRDQYVQEVLKNYHESPTVEQFRGTKWGALNALDEWAEWLRPGRRGDAHADMVNALEGFTRKVRDKALHELVEA